MVHDKLELSLFHIYREGSVNCDEVGEVLICLRRVINSLAMGQNCEKKFISNDIKNENSIYFDGYKKEQSVFIMSSDGDLFGRNRSDTPFYLCIDVLKLMKEVDVNLSLIKEYSLLVKKSFLGFIDCFVKNGLYFSLVVSGRHGRENVSLSIDDLKVALGFLKDFDVLNSECSTYKA